MADVDVLVTALGGQGDGIARLDGEVVLVAGACPGDRVRVTLAGKRRGVQRGDLQRVLEPSPQRVQPPCPVADRCGGCDWQHVDLALQRQQKLGLVARALGRDAPPVQWGGDVPGLGHRRRVRLHLRVQAGRLAVGMMARGSHDVVATPSCPVLEPALEAVRLRLAEVLQPYVLEGEIYLTAGTEGVVAALHARPTGTEPQASALAQQLGLAGLRLQLGRHADEAGLTEVTLPETAGPHPIRVDAAGFCQATQAGNTAIRHAVATALADIGRVPTALEFFAGSGNLTALLLGHADAIRTVEREPLAVARARRSLAGGHVRVHTGDAAREAGPASLWLLDPGRPGARELVVQAAHYQPDHIVYVSCALDTLARDLAELRQAGYRLVSATAVDTFPHTPHTEAIVRLARDGAVAVSAR